MNDVTLTWLGHSTFRIDSAGGKRIYLDPWLKNNPSCPAAEQEPERVDIIAITHGHFDHMEDALELCREFAPPIVSNFEIAMWLTAKGVPDVGWGINKGGTKEIDGIKFTMTQAVHSGGILDEGAVIYGGEPGGYVIEFENGLKIYAAGDTCAFSDMALIRQIHAPEIAILPIGDWFTMGPAEAAVALELLGVTRCIPCHYGTYPGDTGTPAGLREQAPGVDVIELEIGTTVELQAMGRVGATAR